MGDAVPTGYDNELLVGEIVKPEGILDIVTVASVAGKAATLQVYSLYEYLAEPVPEPSAPSAQVAPELEI